MSIQANIRDIQILGDLKTAFGRFGEDVLQVLAALEKQFEEIQERLEERQHHWRRQVDEAEDQVHAARRALRDCENSGYRDEEGDYQEPDCGWAEEGVSDAERHLAAYEENLETVKQWRHRIEGQITDFEGDMHRLSNLASSRTSSVQTFLANKIEILGRYIGGSSAGVGISSLQSQGGNDTIKSREAPLAFNKIDDALLWANRNMHPDHLDLLEPERQALKDYQLGSRELNEALWQGLPLSPEMKMQMQHMDAALARNTTPIALQVWHGSYAIYWEQIEVGEVVAVDSYLSTTLAEQFQDFKHGAWLEITVPKGTPAMFMDNLAGSPLYETEVEILLARGTQIQILSKGTVKGELHIKAEIII